ncbi:uncharacterized protein LOC120337927 [Styela clava]
MLAIVVLVISLCILATDALQPAECEIRFEDLGGSVSTLECPANCDIGDVYVVGGPAAFQPDSLVCAAAIHADAAPVTGEKVVFLKLRRTPPPTMLAGSDNGVNTIAPASAPSSATVFFRYEDRVSPDCAVAAEDIDQEVFVFNCPADCEKIIQLFRSDLVYDEQANIFAIRSLICIAAIYDEALSAGSAGAVVVEKQPGIILYANAPFLRGINPRLLTTYELAFRFSTTIDPDCLQTVSGQPSSFIFTCPDNCSPNLVDIVGDGIYNDKTPICLAAIHDEQITASTGGVVIVNKRPGHSGFSGSTRNGITSISGGPDDGFDFSDCINGSPTNSASVDCSCTANWFGEACNIMCVEGSYDASNNPACTCNSGWVGPMCNFPIC